MSLHCRSRRQFALTLLGIAWISHGLTISYHPGYQIYDQAIIFENWPLQLRVTIWLTTGIAAVALAALGRRRAQAVGFALAIVPPMIRLISYAWSLLMWVVPGAPGGEAVSMAYIGWWGALVALVWWVSRWPEPAQPLASKEGRCPKVS